MAQIIVDEHMLQEPNLLVPSKQPLGPVKYNENWGGPRPEVLWLFNGKGDSVIHDYSGHNNYGTIVGNATSKAGRLDLGTTGDINGVETQTTVYTSSNATTLLMRVKVDEWDSSGGVFWETYTGTNAYWWSDESGNWWISSEGVSEKIDIEGQGWVNIIQIFEGTASDDRISFGFVNGKKIWGSQTWNTDTFSGLKKWNLLLGSSDYNLGGKVEMLAFWDGAICLEFFNDKAKLLSTDPYILFESA